MGKTEFRKYAYDTNISMYVYAFVYLSIYLFVIEITQFTRRMMKINGQFVVQKLPEGKMSKMRWGWISIHQLFGGIFLVANHHGFLETIDQRGSLSNDLTGDASPNPIIVATWRCEIVVELYGNYTSKSKYTVFEIYQYDQVS